MRFARMAAAFCLVAALFTPANRILRAFHARISGRGNSFPLFEAISYLALLLALYGLLILVFWAFRRILHYTESWGQIGLEELEIGVRGSWPIRWCIPLGLLLLYGVARAGAGMLPVAEAIAACGAVFAALLGPPPDPDPVDDYDPLPFPSVPDDPEPEFTDPDPGSGEFKPLRMSWYFREQPGNIGAPALALQVIIRASMQRYAAFQARDHEVRSAADFGRFVREGMAPEISETARRLRSLSGKHSLGTIAEINNVLAFAQRFAYASDREDHGVAEYPKYPLETLVEDRGDCEDHAILAAACLALMGYDVRLVLLDYGPGPGHMALAVAGADELPDAFALRDPVSGIRFYYCEVSTDASSRNPAARSFRMGEIPAADRRARMELISIA